MYGKIHRRLAFLFAGITSLILVILSVSYQFLSEREMRNSSFPAFAGEMNTILSNLENQKTITYEWLSKISANEKYIIALYDNQLPLSYTTTVLTDKEQALVTELLQAKKEIIDAISSYAYYGSIHREFTWRAPDRQLYYVCYSNIHRFSSTLTTVILFSTKDLDNRLMRQRIWLTGLNLAGITLLFLFSYFFTGYLLRPLQISQERQSAFIAAASHELRTPVSVILSSISALKYADAQEQEPFFTIIESEGARMSHLIHELLTLVRSDNHTWSFCMADTELDTLLLNVYEAYKPLAAKEQVRLSLELPEQTFPPCRCDKERITQLLEILLSNAISYSNEKGLVVLRLTCRHHTFRLEVADNGIGISPDAKEHIFERFYQEDPSRSQKEHFGLGLSIAKEIVTAHHGSIQVSDTQGGGATFTVILPEARFFPTE
ncbi:MAG: HAMP domain-containing histidine kinase [Roseburia sp.]|nr:HAMP domain-containing histidine kinase [Roseburia sp.]